MPNYVTVRGYTVVVDLKAYFNSPEGKKEAALLKEDCKRLMSKHKRGTSVPQRSG